MPVMTGLRLLACFLASVVALGAWAQAPNPAEERARLANQRIQVEADRQAAEEERARAERARLANQRIEAEAARQAAEERARQDMAAGAVARQPADAGAARSPTVAAVPSSSVSQSPAGEPPQPTVGAETARQARDVQTSRALEQLRQLGELRDAGYVTDEEFDRIKNRILDDRF